MNKYGLIQEFWAFMKIRKKWWLLPIVVVMLLLGILLAFAETSAPRNYRPLP